MNSPYAGAEDAFPSIAMINGKPAIAVQNPANKTTVDFIRALDENGQEWADPVNANSLGEWGPWFGQAYMSLAEVANRPAIAYFSRNETKPRLYYVRATDSLGEEWAEPVLVWSSFNCNGLTLLEVNGNPAICFYNNNQNGLRYIRADDYLGETWGTALELSPETQGSDATMVLVDGNPAICFSSPLQYIRALDENGDTWGPVQYPISDQTICSFNTMSIVNGTPAITCMIDLAGIPRLSFIRGSNATGSAWDTPVYIADEFEPHHVLEVEGQPVIGGRGWITRAVDYLGFQWEDPWYWLENTEASCFTDMVPVGRNIGVAYYDQVNRELSFVLILH